MMNRTILIVVGLACAMITARCSKEPTPPAKTTTATPAQIQPISPTQTSVQAAPSANPTPLPVSDTAAAFVPIPGKPLPELITEWKSKYPGLFIAHPELEQLLRESKTTEIQDMMFNDYILPGAIEIFAYFWDRGHQPRIETLMSKNPDALSIWSGLLAHPESVIRCNAVTIFVLYTFWPKPEAPKVRKGPIDGMSQVLENMERIRQRSSGAEQPVEINEEAVISQIKKAVPDLVRLLSDRDPGIRYSAIRVLDKLRDHAFLPEFIKMMPDADDEVRIYAMEAIGNLRAKEAAPQIIKALRDKNELVSHYAIQAAAKCSVPEAIPDLIKMMLRDSYFDTEVIRTLIELNARSAVPDLIKMLTHSDCNVQIAAVTALREFQAEEAIPEIIKLLASDDYYTASEAAYTLGEFQARQAIPELIKALSNPVWMVRLNAAQALATLGAKEAIPDIKKLLLDNDDSVSQGAKRALWQLGVSQEEIKKTKEGKK